MEHPVTFWIGFHCLIAILLIVDLGLLHGKARAVRFKEACLLSVGWIAVALLFNLFVYWSLGAESALQFFTGYLIEKSLSVDNLFIFLMLFTYFRVPAAFHHRILYWGILGALIFRLSLILLGVALIERFFWMYYFFGALLVVSGIKFMIPEKKKELAQSPLIQILKKVLPVAKGDGGGRFFVKVGGKWMVTSLFLTLVAIECTDIIMALDSVPAIFAITTDVFIIYTSNVFAILGLRALYFALAASLQKLRYMRFGLAAILVCVGSKMLLGRVVPISVPVVLGVIVGILGVTVLFSWWFKGAREGPPRL